MGDKKMGEKMQEFSIKDLECLTGIKAHTIRVWEQRYGLLAPDRTHTNIRKYSDEDLKLLLNVSLLCNMGFKISQIAQMSEEEIQRNIVAQSHVEDHVQQHCHVLKMAMLSYNEYLFQQTIHRYMDEKGVEKTFCELFIPFLQHLGRLWQAGVICPAQEHFISTLIRQKVFSLIESIPASDEQHKPAVVLYLPEQEVHELSLLMMHYMLRVKGFRSIFLGQSVPMDNLFQVFRRLGKISFISVFTAFPAPSGVADYLKRLKQLFQDTGCRFHLCGNALQEMNSPDDRWIHLYPSAEAILQSFLYLEMER